MRPTLGSLRHALDARSRALLAAAVAVSHAAGASLWLVGGPVRDLAAGLPLRDLDTTTDGDAALLARALAARLGGEAHTEPRFGTARVDVSGRRIDLATLREERYARPGALPAVRLGATLETDLARRDFTVNAMALGVAGLARGRFADPHGGLSDLGARRLRVLHALSFRDDATRLWRAGRFAARLRLRPDRETADSIAAGLHWIDTISARRLWHAFAATAQEARAGRALVLLDTWGVLAATHPAFALDQATRQALARRGALSPEATFACLVARGTATERAAAATRIGAPRSAARAAEEAAHLLSLQGDTPEALDSVSGSGEPARLAARLLDPARQPSLQSALRRWERTRPPLDATELLALGVIPGPAMGETLRWLRRERYVGTLDSASGARALVRARLSHQQSDPPARTER
jgi:tRNA nucleotidyltransferase (CCA-adding enzyme)